MCDIGGVYWQILSSLKQKLSCAEGFPVTEWYERGTLCLCDCTPELWEYALGDKWLTGSVPCSRWCVWWWQLGHHIDLPTFYFDAAKSHSSISTRAYYSLSRQRQTEAAAGRRSKELNNSRNKCSCQRSSVDLSLFKGHWDFSTNLYRENTL